MPNDGVREFERLSDFLNNECLNFRTTSCGGAALTIDTEIPCYEKLTSPRCLATAYDLLGQELKSSKSATFALAVGVSEYYGNRWYAVHQSTRFHCSMVLDV